VHLKEWIRPYYLRYLYFRLFPGRKPAAFEECWRYRSYALANSAAIIPGVEGKPDLLFLPMADWHTRIQRSQQLARALARSGHRCFYLNPHLGRQFPGGYRPGDDRIGELETRIFELHARLPAEPVFHHRLLDVGESRSVADSLETLIGEARITRAVQLISLPLWLDAALELRARHGFPIVYDCHDRLAGFRNMAREIVDYERDTVAASDLVVCSSTRLAEELQRAYPGAAGRVVLVRNGVDAAHFAGVNRERRAGPVVAGYIGALDYWFDTAAVEHAARRHPEWQFVLIGRVEHSSVLRLQHLPNVKLEGEVSYGDLPRQMARFDVGLIPFRINELTLATDPIKLYEYLSAGLPVVSSPLPEVERFGDLVWLARTPEEFSGAMERAVAEGRSMAARFHHAAQRENWDARAAELMAAVNQTLE
jgi:glycosyltransferase involved in cell wall biosynthesis